MGVFDQYSIGTSAMRAFRLGMNVAGYNVANANTPGFSRRRVELGTMATIAVPGGYSGMGVDVESLRRIRDPFLDFAVRRESTRFGFDSSRAEILGALEPALGEVDSAALRASISSFFDSLENLAIQPGDSAIRQDVVSAASQMAATIRQVDGFINQSRRSADEKATAQVERINEILDRLASANLEVTGLEAGGQEASDVRDQRDRLLDELSQMIPVRSVEQDNGQISVYLEGSGDTLLAGTSARSLQISRDADGLARILADRSGELVDLTDSLRGGSLGGYLASRDEDLTSYRQQLDTLAASLIEEVNAVHRTAYDQAGVTGRNLFEPDPPGSNPAAAIRVNAEILDDPSKLATANAPGEPGNNEAVLTMLDLRTAGISGLGGLTFTGAAA
ncbi:MAG TPA: flagellar hook-associated protein FlgK, partial [Acidobacteria bacterium]|nr:flagellar hook-associated protein FlgK [Acidobacteriota bacterium]